jgi:hypothetical protein
MSAREFYAPAPRALLAPLLPSAGLFLAIEGQGRRRKNKMKNRGCERRPRLKPAIFEAGSSVAGFHRRRVGWASRIVRHGSNRAGLQALATASGPIAVPRIAQSLALP